MYKAEWEHFSESLLLKRWARKIFVSLIIPLFKIISKIHRHTLDTFDPIKLSSKSACNERDPGNSLHSFSLGSRKGGGRENLEIPFTSFLESSFRQSRNTESPSVICPFNRLRIGRTGNPARVSRYQSRQRPHARARSFSCKQSSLSRYRFLLPVHSHLVHCRYLNSNLPF